MPRKLENGKYAFKGGCIGEKGTDGKYKLVAVRKKKIKKGKRANNKANSKNNSEKKEIEQKKRRSEKKKFSKITSNQTGGNNSNLDITVHMLREFYSKNF